METDHLPGVDSTASCVLIAHTQCSDVVYIYYHILRMGYVRVHALMEWFCDFLVCICLLLIYRLGWAVSIITIHI